MLGVSLAIRLILFSPSVWRVGLEGRTGGARRAIFMLMLSTDVQQGDVLRKAVRHGLMRALLNDVI